MATSTDFADFVTDQMSGAGNITKRKMMGEYVVYCQEKVIALICDNKLFIKPTDAGRAFLIEFYKKLTDCGQGLIEAPPYVGAKNFFLIEDKLEDRDFMAELIRVSYPELPMPKPKSKSKSKPKPKPKPKKPKTPTPNSKDY